MNRLKGKKFLLGINHLDKLGGSETFTYTLAKQLLNNNAKVDIFTFKEGFISTKFKEINSNKPVIKFDELKKAKYDFAVVSHNTVFGIPFKADKTLQICHGVFPIIEQPTCFADFHISISKEVSNHLTNLGFSNSILYNPVDIDRFNVKRPLNKDLTSILSLCQGEIANRLLEEICSERGIEFKAYNKLGHVKWDIESEINNADLVVTLGRGAIESMACGRSVLIYDSRPYSQPYSDGLLLKENIEAIKECNFSGRKFKNKPTKKYLNNELDKYDVAQGEYNADYAKNNFSIADFVNRLMNVLSNGDTLNNGRKLYKSIFRLYDKKFVTSNNKVYFIYNKQKVLINTNEDLLTCLRTFVGLESSIIKASLDHNLELIPTVPVSLMRQSVLQYKEFKRKK